MTRVIDYGNLMHRAMRGLIQNVLNDVVEYGLPGDHHFFITFDTGHPDVELADWLSAGPKKEREQSFGQASGSRLCAWLSGRHSRQRLFNRVQ